MAPAGEGGTTLPANTRLFDVPRSLVRELDKDLVAAGIARRVNDAAGVRRIDKTDERGRTIDVHALRHTFGTHLSKAGVAPRTAQAAMRHSSNDLTMNVYTDPRLLDVAGAVEALRSLPLGNSPRSDRATLRATGTDGRSVAPFAPAFAPTTDNRCKSGANRDKTATSRGRESDPREMQKTPRNPDVFQAEGTRTSRRRFRKVANLKGLRLIAFRSIGLGVSG